MADVKLDIEANLSKVFNELRTLRGSLTAVEGQQQSINKKMQEMATRGSQAYEKVSKSMQGTLRQNLAQIEAQKKELGLIGTLTAKIQAYQRAKDNSLSEKNVVRYNELIRQTQAEIDRLNGKQAKLADTTNNVAKATANQSNALGDIRNQIVALVGLDFLKTQGEEAINVTARFQGYNRALEVVFGSQQAAAEQLNFVRETVDRFGLSLESTTQGYVKFAGAAKLSGLSTQETQKIFTNVSAAVTSLGLSADDAQGVFLALSQILGKGTVQAEELRGQIGERIPGAFALAAKAIGKTEQELNKMLQNGEVLAKDFLPAFSDELGNRFTASAERAARQTNNLNVAFNKAANAITDFRLKIGNENSTLVSNVLGLVTVDNLQIFLRLLTTAITAFVTYKAVVLAANAANTAYRIGLALTAAVTKLFAKNTGEASGAVGGLAKSFKGNIWATLISFAATAVVSLFDFGKASEDAADKQGELQDQIAETNRLLQEQINQLTNLANQAPSLTVAQIDSGIEKLKNQIKELKTQLGDLLVQAGVSGDVESFLNPAPLKENPNSNFLGIGNGEGLVVDPDLINKTTNAFVNQGEEFTDLGDKISKITTNIGNLEFALQQLEKQRPITVQNSSINYAALTVQKLQELADAGDKLAKKELARREKELKQLQEYIDRYNKLLDDLVERRKKASLELTNNEEERVLLEKKYREEDIENLRKNLTEVKRLAGKGTKLSPEEENIINTLLLASNKQFSLDMAKIVRDRENLINSIETDERAKRQKDFYQELADKEDVLRKAGIDEVSIRKYNELQIKKFDQDTNLKDLEDEENHQLAIAETLDRSSVPLKQAEESLQQDRLEIQIKYAELRLKLLEASGVADQKIIDEVRVKLAQLKKEYNGLLDNISSSVRPGTVFGVDLFKVFGLENLSDDKREGIIKAFKEVYTQITNIASQALEDSTRFNQMILDRLDKRIGETQQKISQAIELQKAGYANNLAEEQANLKNLEAERKKAFVKQQQLEKQKQALEAISQAASLASASASIYASLAKLGPVGIGIAIGTIALMFTSFAAARIKAAGIAKNVPSLGKGGNILEGPSHNEGGLDVVNPKTGEKVMELEGGEAVTNKKSSRVFRTILKALNANKPMEAFKKLREQLGNRAPMSVAEVLNTTREAYSIQQNAIADNRGVEERLDKVESRLADTNKLLSEQEHVTVAGDYVIIKRGNTITKRRIS